MSSNAIETQGMRISIFAGSPTPAAVTINEVKQFTGPDGSASIIDTTDLDSIFKEKRMGLPDEGKFGFTLNYIPANASHAAIRAARASRAKTKFKLEFTDTGLTVWEFEGFVTGFATSGAVDSVVEAQVTVEITGAITEL